MELEKRITQSLKTHDNVLVFTQSEDKVRRFLLDEPGRWNVSINTKVWNKEAFKNEKIYQGQVGEGFKVGLLESDRPFKSDDKNQRVSLDDNKSIGSVRFTKDFSTSLRKEKFILKETLSFPETKIEDHFPPLLAIRKIGAPILIVCSSAQQYYTLHDQLVMQEIDHSIDTSGEFKSIHLMRAPRIIKGYDKAVVYGDVPLASLIPFHYLDQLILVRPKDVYGDVRLKACQSILQCFAEAPESGLSKDYINFKTLLHPKTIDSNLSFLHKANCIKPAIHNNTKVLIHKNQTVPNDIDFNMIPEGEFSIQSLVNHLRIPRESLFSLLKKYERKGLIFSYIPSSAKTLWKFHNELTYERFNEAMHHLQDEEVLLADIINIGAKAINRYLDIKIQNHCWSGKAESIIIDRDSAVSIGRNAGDSRRFSDILGVKSGDGTPKPNSDNSNTSLE